jgi:hypothetical protein
MTLAWSERKLVAVTILLYPAGSSRMLGSLPKSIVTKLESGKRSSESVLINKILRWERSSMQSSLRNLVRGPANLPLSEVEPDQCWQ